MNTKRLFQSMACAVLAFAVTAPVLARDDDDRGRDRDRSHHYDRRDDRRDDRREWRGDRRDDRREWRGDRRDDRREWRDDRRDQRHAYRNGYRDGRRDDRRHDRRYDDRRYYAPQRVVYRPAPGYHRWAKGQRYRDHYRGPVYVVNDYDYYDLRRPPRGYHWVRDDRGNMLMVAIATGIIADLLLHH